MKDEDIVKIHLPNGKTFEVILDRPTLTEEEIVTFRNMMVMYQH